MPKTSFVLYREDDGGVPFLDWFAGLPTKAQDKCRIRIERLRELGHELRRPEADYLRDGIYELRAGVLGVQYRILYFFRRKIAVVISHGLVKEREVPTREIARALLRKARFEKDPETHTHREI